MNLWKMELIHLFRSWRGWTLLGFYLLASVLAIVIGYFIERNTGQFSYASALDIYMIISIVGLLIYIGIVVSSHTVKGRAKVPCAKKSREGREAICFALEREG